MLTRAEAEELLVLFEASLTTAKLVMIASPGELTKFADAHRAKRIAFEQRLSSLTEKE